jgi:transcriptional regulator with XRE-family HTH domain
MLTAEQVRAARALLRWDQAVLAEKAAVSVETIKRLERMDGPLRETRSSTLAAIEQAFVVAGVEFTNGGRPGVRMQSIASALKAVVDSLRQSPPNFVNDGPALPSEAEKKRRVNRFNNIIMEIETLAGSDRHDAQSVARYEAAVAALHDLGTRVNDQCDGAVHRAFVAAGY